MTTLYTAKKYAVPALEAHCVEFLKKNLRADNAFMLLTQVGHALYRRIHSIVIDISFYFRIIYVSTEEKKTSHCVLCLISSMMGEITVL